MRNVKARIALLALGSLVLLNACNAQDDKKAAAPADAVLVTVNGAPVYQSMLDGMLKQAAAQNAPDTPEIRKAMLDDLVLRELAKQDAVKQGLDKRPEVKQQMELAQSAILVNTYIQDFVKATPPTDDQLKAEYDRIKTQIGDKEYQARHILVKTEKEATDLLAQLKKGAKFDKLASTKSLDQGSKVRGGNLDFAPPSRFVKPFSEALVALKKGETTQKPVKTEFGYHIIKLEDVRELPPFDAIKANLAPRVQQEILRKRLEDLRAKAKVEYKGAQAPAATTTTIPGPITPTDKPKPAAENK